MDPVTIGALIKVGGELIDRLFPDKTAAAEAKLKLFELTQKGELAQLDADVRLASGQMEINKVEAAHRTVWVAGWRPFVGWSCGGGLFYEFLLRQFMNWALTLSDPTLPLLPSLDLAPLITLLGGLLGIGTLRTYEKIKGVAK